MQLHAGLPGDMTESSLAGSRDELLLHFFVPFIHGCLALRLRVIVRERKKTTTTQEPKHPEAAACCHLGRELVTKESCKHFEWENSSDLPVGRICLSSLSTFQQIMLEAINAPAMYVATQPVLSFFAFKRTTAIMMHDELRVAPENIPSCSEKLLALPDAQRCQFCLCALRHARPVS